MANAICDGTSAVMLSAETAMGHYPVEAVETMARIARRTERDGILAASRPGPPAGQGSIPEATVRAAAVAATDAGAAAIAVLTRSGRTAKLVARERLPLPVVALTPSRRTYQKLALVWERSPS